MKVLHVLDHSVPLFSGYSFRSANIVKFQKALGMNPIVLTSPKHGSLANDVEEIDGIRYYRTAALRENSTHHLPFFKEIRLMSQLKERMAEVVSSEKIDLIHSHSPSLNGLPAWRVARNLRIPFVYEARAFWEDAAVDHGTFGSGSMRYRVSRAVETFVFRKADAVIVIAEGMREELSERGISKDRISVIPNGVDVEGFHPRERNRTLAEQLGLDGGPVFGFIGSFYHYEGLRLLLDAFPAILAQVPGARLLLIGGGPEEQVLKEAGRRYDGAVKMIRNVPHAQVPDYYSVIDVLIYPRQKMRLTDLVTPLKPLEAMAMGKAIVASDVGGHRELIQHGVTGLLFRADDATALTREGIRAATDRDLREKLGKVGRKHVEDERGWPEIVSKYLTIYNRLLH
jgi:glycogen(starch) synthase